MNLIRLFFDKELLDARCPWTQFGYCAATDDKCGWVETILTKQTHRLRLSEGWSLTHVEVDCLHWAFAKSIQIRLVVRNNHPYQKAMESKDRRETIFTLSANSAMFVCIPLGKALFMLLMCFGPDVGLVSAVIPLCECFFKMVFFSQPRSSSVVVQEPDCHRNTLDRDLVLSRCCSHTCSRSEELFDHRCPLLTISHLLRSYFGTT